MTLYRLFPANTGGLRPRDRRQRSLVRSGRQGVERTGYGDGRGGAPLKDALVLTDDHRTKQDDDQHSQRQKPGCGDSQGTAGSGELPARKLRATDGDDECLRGRLKMASSAAAVQAADQVQAGQRGLQGWERAVGKQQQVLVPLGVCHNTSPPAAGS